MDAASFLAWGVRGVPVRQDARFRFREPGAFQDGFTTAAKSMAACVAGGERHSHASRWPPRVAHGNLGIIRARGPMIRTEVDFGVHAAFGGVAFHPRAALPCASIPARA